jgi:diadenosine tetraphosphate (Ap4A) HIT family hydrolase
MYNQDNIFARISRGELPCKKVYEDAGVLAFHDVNPAASVHVLVIPKGAYISFHDFATNASAQDMHHFFLTVQKVAESLGLGSSGYRLITNHGADGMQTVPHFHVHILGGQPIGPLTHGDLMHENT